jgi:hypothetical protein
MRQLPSGTEVPDAIFSDAIFSGGFHRRTAPADRDLL